MQKADECQHSTACRNCGTTLCGRFCHACSQEDRDLSVPFSTLLVESLGDLFSFDSRLLRTLRPLILRPGMLTTEFMVGRRAPYVPPFRLYLFISILMFVVVGLSGHSLVQVGDDAGKDRFGGTFHFGDYEPDQPDEDTPSEEAGDREAHDETHTAAPDANKGTDSELDWTDRFDEHLSALGEDPEALDRMFRERLAQSFFILLPIVALLLKVLYWRHRLRYLHHLIFALHFHSFSFLLIAITVIVGMALPGDTSVSVVVPFWVLIYLVLSLKRAYGQGWTWTALKTVSLMIAYFPVLVATMLGALLVTALF